MPESRRKLGSLEQNWDPRISAKNSEIIEKVMKKSNINFIILLFFADFNVLKIMFQTFCNGFRVSFHKIIMF